MKLYSKKVACIAAAAFQLSACATPYGLADPAQDIAVYAVLKSIKCEMITFIEANRQQRERFGKAYKNNKPNAYEHRYLDLADNLFAGVYVELNEVDNKSLTVGFNKISRLSEFKSLTLLAGPSASSTDTFEVKQNFAILQAAKLYRPSYPVGSIPEHKPAAEGFDCYNSIPVGPEIDFSSVSANTYGSNFRRIWIGQDQTLSQWLQNITVDMSRNYLTSVDNSEIMAPGQLSYSFSLEYKVGVDGKYELIAQIWNPLSISPTASVEKRNTFRFIFNTNYAPIALAADSGAVGVEKIPCIATAKIAFGDCELGARHGQTYLNRRGRAVANGATISPSQDNRTPFDERNNPSVFFSLPFGLPLSQSRR